MVNISFFKSKKKKNSILFQKRIVDRLLIDQRFLPGETTKDHNMKVNVAVLLGEFVNFSIFSSFLKTSTENLKKRAKVIGMFLIKNFKTETAFFEIDFGVIKHF
jgi:hypothetical protein